MAIQSNNLKKNKEVTRLLARQNHMNTQYRNGQGVYFDIPDFQDLVQLTPDLPSSKLKLSHTSGYAHISIMGEGNKYMYDGIVVGNFSWTAPKGRKFLYVFFGTISHFGAKIKLESVTFSV